MIARATDPVTATTVEDNPSETLARRLRAHLQALAPRRLPITYREAAKGLLLLPPNTMHQVTEEMDQIMAKEPAADRPFIVAMDRGKGAEGTAAPGASHCQARTRTRDQGGHGADA